MGEIRGPFEFLDLDGQPCYPDKDKRVRWSGVRPQQVLLRWTADGQKREAFVPVLDEYGRICATILPKIDIDQAWLQLANFPMPQDEPTEPGEPNGRTGVGPPVPGVPANASYPIREMMQLIENIAAKQSAVSQIDWPAWCIRLEQCLIQASGDQLLEAFTKFDLNPLSPLWYSPFRPDYAVTAATKEGQAYEVALTRIELDWKVNDLPKIGGPS